MHKSTYVYINIVLAVAPNVIMYLDDDMIVLVWQLIIVGDIGSLFVL